MLKSEFLEKLAPLDDNQRKQVISDLKNEVMARIDIADVILQDTDLRKRGRRYEGLCSIHNEKTPSMKVDPDKQTFHCFGCGAGGSALDYIMQTRQMGFLDALLYLGSDTAAWVLPAGEKRPPRKTYVSPIKEGNLRVPKFAKPFVAGEESPWIFNQHGGEDGGKFGKIKPQQVYTYRSTDGKRILGYVLRRNFTDEETGRPRKMTPTVTWCKFEHEGKVSYNWSYVPFDWGGRLKPLYMQEMILLHPDVPIVIHEGEKAVDAAYELLPDAVHITWPGGTQGITEQDTGRCLIDLSPLKGRNIIIFPDADEPGYKAAAQLLIHLQEVEPADAIVVRAPDGVEKGWDIADAKAAGWTPEMVFNHIAERHVSPEEFLKLSDVLFEYTRELVELKKKASESEQQPETPNMVA